MNKKRHGLDLTQGRVSTLMLRFALPFMLASLVNALYGIIDMYVIGEYADTATVAGVATGTQVMGLIFSVMIGIGTGGTVLIGRCIGEKNDQEGSRAAGTFIFTGICLAALLTAFVLIFREPLLTALKTPAEARRHARDFVLYCSLGVPFNVGFAIFSAIARGMGNSRVPGLVSAASCGVNIGLAFLLVGALRMGAVGVGIATALAQVVSFVLMGAWLLKTGLPFPFAREDVRFAPASGGFVFQVGLPIALQEVLVSISFMIITGIVNNMHTVASAAVGIVSRIFMIFTLIPFAIGSAISAMTAQNIGAGMPDRARKSLYWGIGYSLILEICLVLCSQLWPEKITGFFSNDPAVITAAAAYLRTFSLDGVLIAFVFCMNGYLTGCGKSLVSMAHSIVATFALRVPLSIIFTRIENTDLNGKMHYLGFSAPIASLLSIVVCVAYILWHDRRQKLARLGSQAGV